jgi:hypothetical protein
MGATRAAIRSLIVAAIGLMPISTAGAAELFGVALPDITVADGMQMRLNGIGLRTYSMLKIPIYVAGLYLERPSRDGNGILHSPQRKLLKMRFLHDVDAEDAREAWRDGLKDNCTAPCSLDPHAVERFLAAVPSMHNGDESTMLFTVTGMTATVNGRVIGAVPDPNFASALLATFIGAVPPTPQLKRQLLGSRE